MGLTQDKADECGIEFEDVVVAKGGRGGLGNDRIDVSGLFSLGFPRRDRGEE